jgi:hypothetical protein
MGDDAGDRPVAVTNMGHPIELIDIRSLGIVWEVGLLPSMRINTKGT